MVRSSGATRPRNTSFPHPRGDSLTITSAPPRDSTGFGAGHATRRAECPPCPLAYRSAMDAALSFTKTVSADGMAVPRSASIPLLITPAKAARGGGGADFEICLPGSSWYAGAIRFTGLPVTLDTAILARRRWIPMVCDHQEATGRYPGISRRSCAFVGKRFTKLSIRSMASNGLCPASPRRMTLIL